MCPPLCSAGAAALFNFALLTFSFTLPDWGPAAALVFAVPFGASIVLLGCYWNARVAWYAGWVLLLSGVAKVAACVFFSVNAAIAGAAELGWLSQLGAIVFTALAIGSALSGAVDSWAGYSYACGRRGGKGSRSVRTTEAAPSV